jgi:hypothetical protein
MIKKIFKTANGKLEVSIPDKLAEITLAQMMALQQADGLTDIDAISILSNMTKDELMQIIRAEELLAFGEPILRLAIEINHLYNSDAIPEKININYKGKDIEVSVSRNLAMEPAGAFMAARDAITEEITKHIKQYGEADWQGHFNPSLATCCTILAQYFYCRVSKLPYNEYEVTNFIETIKTMRVTEALPIAKHFFYSYPSISRPKVSFWQQLRQLWKNAQEYRRLKNSGMLIP